ncbi:unnamed protein product [Microthlaspi erraticum]|uniref:Replication protein A 70 kDa DNA-binding subunit B/D first OB fold domain-containing protein n=1 Tax=Microthlaspi erraticum TaxID=1685480 RepID=A0A6D2HQX9_9BRAS|nr:unnamed protein product [Microthlaspi erraticum]
MARERQQRLTASGFAQARRRKRSGVDPLEPRDLPFAQARRSGEVDGEWLCSGEKKKKRRHYKLRIEMASIVDFYSCKPFKSQWKIRVKILKTMEMIVVNEKDQVIHCTVKKEFIKRMDVLLVEGETKIITNFQVTPTSGRFRTSGHQYMICLAQTTTIKTDTNIPSDVIGFNPVRFTDIHEGKLNPDFLLDVMGQIVEIGNVEILNVSKKQTKRMTMVFRDLEDVRLNYVLWGEFAEQLEAYAQNVHDAVVVFVLRFGKIRLYQDVWSVGNCYNCSMVMLNSKLPEIADFKDSWSSSTLPLYVKISFHRPPVGRYPRSLMLLRRAKGRFLPVNMEALKEETPGGDFSKQLWKCPKCEDHVDNVMPAFLLTFRVIDATGETKFLLFDKLAMEVVNQTAAELVVDHTEDIPLMILDGPSDEVTPSSKRKSEEYDEKNELETRHSSVKKPCFDGDEVATTGQGIVLKQVKVEKTN